MPVHNNDQNTIGIFRIDLNEKSNLLYRQLSGPSLKTSLTLTSEILEVLSLE